MFKTEVYQQRRAVLKKQLSKGVVLLLGNNESPMNYPDNPFHFRQDSTFLYYIGLDQAGLAAVIDVDEGKDILFGDDLTTEDIVWMGYQPKIKERAQMTGITDTRPLKELAPYITQAIASNRPILFIPQYRGDNMIKLGELLSTSANNVNNLASIDLIKAVVAQRNIKSAEEITEIEKAVNISVDMHLAAMRMVAPGKSEAEIAAAVHQIALAANGNLAFPIIATVHGETLHNHYHGNIMKQGDMFLLDAGAETARGYAGDLSSTIPVSKTFTSRQREIYQVAYLAHEEALSQLKPGIPFKEIHLNTCRKIVRGLKELGLMKGDADEAVNQGAHALFFPCGLGHMMGLDVHDMENLGEHYVGYGEGMKKSTQFGLKSLRLGRKLQPGFVLTIEPGIYFIPQLIDLWKGDKRFTDFINYDKVESYKEFGGIRNEEDVVINETGYRILGKPLPKSIKDVEAER
jgi:Xaa-Pro aminopeptidase